MTSTALVFDPFSEECFTDPYGIYRRMRDEAPVYYNEQYDFLRIDSARRRLRSDDERRHVLL